MLNNNVYIGLMSGTSLDGVDAVLARWPSGSGQTSPALLGHVHLAFPAQLRASLLALQTAAPGEIHQEALAANQLANLYATAVAQVLAQAQLKACDVRAVGSHGQTIRHRPELGYTRQIQNPALLAELSGIDVIADFRSRDIAAGGQGAPLVPAFHQAMFACTSQTRVVLNIGGISNLSILEPGNVIGFDTGPGNVLLDTWIAQQRGLAYDANGDWAASGVVHADLLQALLNEPYLALPPPKSTGRDLFHPAWLQQRLASFPGVAAADVQATLVALTATTIADAIHRHAPQARAVYACGGGVFNRCLMRLLEQALQHGGQALSLHTTAAMGVAPMQVEALAFAWLAQQFCERRPGNLAAVTGAQGPRILGALYPH